MPAPATTSSPAPPSLGNDIPEGSAPNPGRLHSLLRSFRFAFAGLFYAFRTQRNLRIHIAFTILGTIMGILLGLSFAEWAVFALTATLVMSAEMTNTMIESLVDLVTGEYHPLAKVAKDVAAGVVLLTAMGSVAVGLFLFLPKLLHVFRLVP